MVFKSVLNDTSAPDCDFLPGWRPFCRRRLFLKPLCVQGRWGQKQTSVPRRCGGKENKRATVFYLCSPSGKCKKKRTIFAVFKWQWFAPQKRKGYECSGGVKNGSSYLVWLGKNGILGWMCEAGGRGRGAADTIRLLPEWGESESVLTS